MVTDPERGAQVRPLRNAWFWFMVAGIVLAVASVGYYFSVWNANAVALEAHRHLVSGRTQIATAIMKSEFLSTSKVYLAPIAVTKAKMIAGAGLAVSATLMLAGWACQRRFVRRYGGDAGA